jgi:hypothetical protein
LSAEKKIELHLGKKFYVRRSMRTTSTTTILLVKFAVLYIAFRVQQNHVVVAFIASRVVCDVTDKFLANLEGLLM